MWPINETKQSCYLLVVTPDCIRDLITVDILIGELEAISLSLLLATPSSIVLFRSPGGPTLSLLLLP